VISILLVVVLANLLRGPDYLKIVQLLLLMVLGFALVRLVRIDDVNKIFKKSV